MVANRTREMRLSGMTRGAYGNVNHGQGLNGHVPRKRRNSQASGLKLRAPYLYPDHKYEAKGRDRFVKAARI